MEKDRIFICKVIKVLDEYKLVINKGSDDGIKEGYKFIVYSLGEELFDPDTKESLGQIELVKGYGEAVHVQNRLTTLAAYKIERCPGTKTIVKNNNPIVGILGEKETITYEENEEIIPFEKPAKGDYAKYIP